MNKHNKLTTALANITKKIESVNDKLKEYTVKKLTEIKTNIKK